MGKPIPTKSIFASLPSYVAAMIISAILGGVFMMLAPNMLKSRRTKRREMYRVQTKEKNDETWANAKRRFAIGAGGGSIVGAVTMVMCRKKMNQ